jgi:hypothetical protein
VTRTYTRSFVYVLLTVGLFVLLVRAVDDFFAKPQSRVPTIEQVQQLSELVTLKVDVADIQQTEIRGYVGGTKAAILVKGDVRLAVDLSQAKFQTISENRKMAVLVLPQPHVSSPRLDHARTRLFTVQDQGLWQIVPGDAAQTAVLNKAYREAQDVVRRAGQSPELVEQAKRQAEKVLTTFFEAMGWKVVVRWN